MEWVFPTFLVLALVGGMAFALLRTDQPVAAEGEEEPTSTSSTYTWKPSSSPATGTEASALAVAVVGDANGYILDTRSPTYEESMQFAYMSALECQSIANGEKTWAQSRAESISTGATPTEAGAMTSYWESTFCPSLDLSAL